jgi:Tol biopolymer transport system component
MIVFQRLVNPVYSGSEDGDLAIFVMNADGSNVRRVTQFAPHGGSNVGYLDHFGRLSPNGTRVLFTNTTTADGGTPARLYACDLTGSRQRLVSTNAEQADWASNGWLTYLKVDSHGQRQVAVRSPGTPGTEYVLTSHTYGVTAPRFRS